MCKCVSDAGRETARARFVGKRKTQRERGEALFEIIDHQWSASGSSQSHHGQLG